MKLIVGLGNPGQAYRFSRHNVGFSVIEESACKLRVKLRKEFFLAAMSGRAQVAGQTVMLVKPLTYMNLSGNALKALVKKYRVDLEDILVICDDLDLDLGRIKIKADGSSGGHNGLASIFEALGSRDIARVRIGISRPHKNIDAADYVLSNFSASEKSVFDAVVEETWECVAYWVEHGIEKSMNRYNKKERVSQ